MITGPLHNRLSRFRYLTFEVNSECRLAQIHPRCPVSDPDRYLYGPTDRVLDDDSIVSFWRWTRVQGFNGVILWHLYNEPALSLDRITSVMARMRQENPTLRSHLWTAVPSVKRDQSHLFEHIELTDYRVVRPDDLDRRRFARGSEGDYARSHATGCCTRDKDWELIIDNHGNWLACCSDWQAEGSVGNIFRHEWSDLLCAYEVRSRIEWRDRETFEALPRMCRGCITDNPLLHRSALPPSQFGGVL